MELHPLEIKVLLRCAPGEEVSHARLAAELGYNQGQANQALSWLSAKGFVKETTRSGRTFFELTDMGREAREKGTAEERILALLQTEGALALPEISRKLALDPKDVGSAFGGLSKDGALRMDAEKRASLADPAGGARARLAATRALLDRAAGTGLLDERGLSEEEKAVIGPLAKKRAAGSSLFRLVEREDVTYALTPAGAEARKALREAGATGDEAGALTPEMLKSGEWKNLTFRRYNINVPPSRVLLGRKNPYCLFL
jgi:phenylalanyl-tRNA synthetase alpha chain